MDPRITPLTEILRMNTKLFRNCLDGVTEEMAGMRPSSTTNNAAFVATHLAEARIYLLQMLGSKLTNPFAAYAENARGIDDVKQFPAMTEIQGAWTAVSHAP